MMERISDQLSIAEGDAESVGMSSDKLERVSSFVQGAVNEGILPLAEILIARRGKVVCHRSFTHPRIEDKGYQIQADSLFYLASFAEFFVVTLIMQQVEQGHISLGRPIAQYIPEFGQRDKETVTVRHLLSHASGLPDQISLPALEVKSIPEYIEAICREPLVFKPGTRGSYCTWGFVVLAELLRRVSGKSLEELGREQLFDPLGMSNTHFGYEEAWAGHILPVFDIDLKLHETLNGADFLAMLRGDTGAYSNALDIAILCQMMLNKGSYSEIQILSPVSVQRMVEQQYPWWDTPERLSGTAQEQFVHLSKGLGWMARGESFYRGADLMSPRAFFHGGHMGMRAIVDPDYDLITVFMTSIVATAPNVSAYFGDPGQVHHTFGSMAFAAVTTL